MNSTLLLVEDDQDLGLGLKAALEFRGYRVVWEVTGRGAIWAASNTRFGACILDLGLPDLDGSSIIRDLRVGDAELPVLVLSARDAVREKVRVLNLGADDYVLKPIELDELVARLQAITRRGARQNQDVIQAGEITIDIGSRCATVGETPVDLTTKEFDLLLLLAKAYGKVVARETMRSALDKWVEDRESNSLDVHIHNLRKKLGGDFIGTVRGVGYIIKKG
jgi:DNA-binding response OmpR family regulator